MLTVEEKVKVLGVELNEPGEKIFQEKMEVDSLYYWKFVEMVEKEDGDLELVAELHSIGITTIRDVLKRKKIDALWKAVQVQDVTGIELAEIGFVDQAKIKRHRKRYPRRYYTQLYDIMCREIDYESIFREEKKFYTTYYVEESEADIINYYPTGFDDFKKAIDCCDYQKGYKYIVQYPEYESISIIIVTIVGDDIPYRQLQEKVTSYVKHKRDMIIQSEIALKESRENECRPSYVIAKEFLNQINQMSLALKFDDEEYLRILRNEFKRSENIDTETKRKIFRAKYSKAEPIELPDSFLDNGKCNWTDYSWRL
jgi:hypothetical protein